MRSMLSALTAIALCALALTPASAQDTIPNDVTATFTVCLEGAGGSVGDVCITGGADVLTNWGSGVTMTNVEGDLYTVDVIFPAGTAATVEYKYRREDCVDWENDPNRSITLPTDGTATVEQEPESFNRFTPIGCGLSGATTEDKTVCFQICLDGVAYTGDSCVIGNIDALGSWETGLVLEQVGVDVWQTCVTFPAGTGVPLDIQYKFQIDDCTFWETIDEDPFTNRTLELTADSPAVQTVDSVWENGDGFCGGPVDTDDESWGTVKSRYRD
ncbi:MAG TPA: carbohydrate-binding module family 20 domain-containing protein [Candidatus Krumholzibacteria bacterium]|nr:carbohydrate-binding module family 20 domain-containing protein [Candidatus Krumholzibacteria bacterium]